MTTQAVPQPTPSVPFGYWMEVMKNYATFTGRARRAEYWSFALVNLIIAVAWYCVLYFVFGMDSIGVGQVLYWCYSLATIIPSIAVSVRRLHDSGRSGWYFLITFIPLVNLLMLYYMLVDSQPGPNEYGPNPKMS